MASKRLTKADLVDRMDQKDALLESMALRNGDLEERIAELEFGLEDRGWLRQGWEHQNDMSREGIRKIAALSRIYFLKNPLVQRGILTQAQYVFGQGVTFKADDPDVNEVIHDFIDDPQNQRELTGHAAMLAAECELQVEGQLFLYLNADVRTGHVSIRNIPAAEIVDIIYNPEDKAEPWFYVREMSVEKWDLNSGRKSVEVMRVYYVDIDSKMKDTPDTIGGKPVEVGRVMHIKGVTTLPDMKFGIPETYAALDWARAYRSFLENWATIQQALARFAARITTSGGSRGVTNAKTRLNTTISETQSETNPPPLVGSTFLGTSNVQYDVIRTAGATTGPEEGRRLLLMVAAALGIPETYFGDLSQGNHATAKTMDRPTELKMTTRQELWRSIFLRVFKYVIVQSIMASGGKLKGSVTDDEYGVNNIELEGDKDNTREDIDILFPPVLEHDLKETVDAAVAAKGSGTMPPKVISQILFTAFNVENADALLEEMYPDETDRDIMDPPGEKPDPMEMLPGQAPPTGPGVPPARPGQPTAGPPIPNPRGAAVRRVAEAYVNEMERKGNPGLAAAQALRDIVADFVESSNG